MRSAYRALGPGFPAEALNLFSEDAEVDGDWCVKVFGRTSRCLRASELATHRPLRPAGNLGSHARRGQAAHLQAWRGDRDRLHVLPAPGAAGRTCGYRSCTSGPCASARRCASRTFSTASSSAGRRSGACRAPPEPPAGRARSGYNAHQPPVAGSIEEATDTALGRPDRAVPFPGSPGLQERVAARGR